MGSCTQMLVLVGSESCQWHKYSARFGPIDIRFFGGEAEASGQVDEDAERDGDVEPGKDAGEAEELVADVEAPEGEGLDEFEEGDEEEPAEDFGEAVAAEAMGEFAE